MSEVSMNGRWKNVQIKAIATEVFDGPFGSHLKTNDYTNAGVRVVRLENIGSLCFFTEKETFISPAKYETLKRHTLKEDDIIFSSFISEEIRVCSLPKAWSGKAINKSDCFCIRPDPQKCLPKFLELRLACHSTFTVLGGNIHGATRPRIKLSQLKDYSFGLPPLAEQKRIAETLEAVLERVDACRVRLDRVPALLKRFRQSVLAAATSGVLTEEWRRSRKVASWSEQPLGNLCEKGRIITYGVIKLGNETPKGVPCLRTSNVRWLNIDTAGMKRIEKSLSNEYSRTILNGGEVLVNVRGTLGGVAVTEKNMVGWNVSREVAVVPVDQSILLPRFLAFWIGTVSSQAWLTGVQKGVAYTGINIEDLRLLPIGIPSLAEQQEIVRRVEALFAMADRIEARVATAQKTVERLTPATLAKAFRGELVPQEPDDEPASAHLKRLGGEKAPVSGKSTRGKRTKVGTPK